MALLKSVPAKWGLNATYWSLTDVNINWVNSSAHVVLSGYIDENSKKVKGEAPVEQRSFDYSSETLPFTKGGNSEEEAYLDIKTTDEFSDAVDG